MEPSGSVFNGARCRDGLPFPKSESRVTCLKLFAKLTAAVMAGIRCLLRGLNCLEKLCITKASATYDLPWFLRHDLYLASEVVETGLDLKLKTVEIIGFAASESVEFGERKAEVLLLEGF